jgi:hypothetical protein
VTEPQETAPEGADTSIPSIARIYDYYLGGTHNYAVDREAAARVTDELPTLPAILRVNRAFLRRCVRHLAELGVRRFLDLGSGIPTVDNVHDIVQGVDPSARVVYVDNDPVAVAHSRRILAGNENAAAVAGDLRDPEKVLGDPDVVRLLLPEPAEPFAVIMSSVLHFVPDDAEAAALVAAYREAMPAGSYLAVSHGARNPADDPRLDRAAATYSRTIASLKLRSHRELGALLEGFDLLEPGIVYCSQWRPEPGAPVETGGLLPQIGALAVKREQ